MRKMMMNSIFNKMCNAMKKSIILLAAALLAAACQKAEMEPLTPVEHIRTFTATFSELTKTDLGEDLTPVWGAGDAVWLSDGINQEVVGVRPEDIGQAKALFTTTSLTGETVYALYPASSAIGRTGSGFGGESVYFNIPESTDGSFKNANICAAVSTDSDLCFKNATSLIRFTKTSADVVSLSLIRTDGGFLSGWMSFRPWDGYHLGSTHRAPGCIVVDMSSSGPYYAAVSPTTLPAGSKIVMTTSTGKHYVRTLGSDNTFTLNKIKTISVDAALSGATEVPANAWAGSGTSTDPYLIASGDDLKLLAEKVNGKEDYFTNKYFKLVSDISVSSYRPIGSSNDGNGFQGNFDGDYHTITVNGFDWTYLDKLSKDGYEVYWGLFGWVKGSATMTEQTRVIQNVRVAGTIDSSSSEHRGPHYYGSVCARATGNLKFEQCGSSLNMTVNAYYSSSASKAKLQAAGGVVGYAGSYNTGTNNSASNTYVQISRCYNTGNLTAYTNASSGTRLYIGGICGNFYGHGLMRLCYNTGTIMGQMVTYSGYGAFVAGIAASNSTAGQVEGCYNQGTVLAYGPSSTSAKAAGITYYSRAIYCYNSGRVQSVYVGNTNTETSNSAGISCVQSNEYQHCFYLQGTASNAFVGSGATSTDCNFFIVGDETNGGNIGGDPANPVSLLDALNGYEAMVVAGDPHFHISPTADHLPVLDYVSRNILDY